MDLGQADWLVCVLKWVRDIILLKGKLSRVDELIEVKPYSGVIPVLMVDTDTDKYYRGRLRI